MLAKLFGSKNQREIKKLSKVVDRINALSLKSRPSVIMT